MGLQPIKKALQLSLPSSKVAVGSMPLLLYIETLAFQHLGKRAGWKWETQVNILTMIFISSLPSFFPPSLLLILSPLFSSFLYFALPFCSGHPLGMSKPLSDKIFPDKLDLASCSDFVATPTKRCTLFLSLDWWTAGPSIQADRCQYPSQSLSLMYPPKNWDHVQDKVLVPLEFRGYLDVCNWTDGEGWLLTFFCSLSGLSNSKTLYCNFKGGPFFLSLITHKFPEIIGITWLIVFFKLECAHGPLGWRFHSNRLVRPRILCF